MVKPMIDRELLGTVALRAIVLLDFQCCVRLIGFTLVMRRWARLADAASNARFPVRNPRACRCSRS